MLNELALFAGAGGGILGGHLLGWRTVCAVELNPFCRRVLMQRQNDRVLPPFPIWDDVRTFDGNPWRGIVDVVSAGFPCQPFSIAGKRLGEKDERNMWPDTIRIIREVRPKYALLENVPGLLTYQYFGRILGDLAESGMDARWCCISASKPDDRFHGTRLWMLAAARGIRWDFSAYEARVRTRCHQTTQRAWCKKGNVLTERNGDRIYCFPHTDISRSFDDMAYWVEQLKAIGNGQIPAMARAAWGILGK